MKGAKGPASVLAKLPELSQMSPPVRAAVEKYRYHLLGGSAAFKPEQDKALRAVLSGKCVSIVAPTGSGKSITFALPALVGDAVAFSSENTDEVLFPKAGPTVVISPLLALMKDQVMKMESKGFDATRVTSLTGKTTPTSRLKLLTRLEKPGELSMLYVTPESLVRNDSLKDKFLLNPPRRFVFDEAHCVIDWGSTFRDSYIKAATIVRSEFPDVPWTMATATSPPNLRRKLYELMGVDELVEKDKFVEIETTEDRTNLSYEVISKPADRAAAIEKLAEYLRLFSTDYGGKFTSIVYVATRDDAVAVAEGLKNSNPPVKATAYHAGLNKSKLDVTQSEWMKGELPVLVATSAFGMGIDNPNVRLVVHFTIPSTLLDYSQQAGRAGRDGHPARCVVMYSSGDYKRALGMSQMYGLDAAYEVEQAYGLFSERNTCVRRGLAKYFQPTRVKWPQGPASCKDVRSCLCRRDANYKGPEPEPPVVLEAPAKPKRVRESKSSAQAVEESAEALPAKPKKRTLKQSVRDAMNVPPPPDAVSDEQAISYPTMDWSGTPAVADPTAPVVKSTPLPVSNESADLESSPSTPTRREAAPREVAEEIAPLWSATSESGEPAPVPTKSSLKRGANSIRHAIALERARLLAAEAAAGITPDPDDSESSDPSALGGSPLAGARSVPSDRALPWRAKLSTFTGARPSRLARANLSTWAGSVAIEEDESELNFTPVEIPLIYPDPDISVSRDVRLVHFDEFDPNLQPEAAPVPEETSGIVGPRLYMEHMRDLDGDLIQPRIIRDESGNPASLSRARFELDFHYQGKTRHLAAQNPPPEPPNFFQLIRYFSHKYENMGEHLFSLWELHPVNYVPNYVSPILEADRVAWNKELRLDELAEQNPASSSWVEDMELEHSFPTSIVWSRASDSPPVAVHESAAPPAASTANSPPLLASTLSADAIPATKPLRASELMEPFSSEPLPASPFAPESTSPPETAPLSGSPPARKGPPARTRAAAEVEETPQDASVAEPSPAASVTRKPRASASAKRVRTAPPPSQTNEWVYQDSDASILFPYISPEGTASETPAKKARASPKSRASTATQKQEMSLKGDSDIDLDVFLKKQPVPKGSKETSAASISPLGSPLQPGSKIGRGARALSTTASKRRTKKAPSEQSDPRAASKRFYFQDSLEYKSVAPKEWQFDVSELLNPGCSRPVKEPFPPPVPDERPTQVGFEGLMEVLDEVSAKPRLPVRWHATPEEVAAYTNRVKRAAFMWSSYEEANRHRDVWVPNYEEEVLYESERDPVRLARLAEYTNTEELINTEPDTYNFFGEAAKRRKKLRKYFGDEDTALDKLLAALEAEE